MKLKAVLFLTGEGASDIGKSDFLTGEFQPGTMAYVAEALVERYCPSIGIDYRFTQEQELTKLVRRSSASKRQAVIDVRGGKTKKFPGLWLRARVFATEVCAKASPTPESLVAILFTDADGTHSSSRHQWKQKFDAILAGFEAGGCKYGVPMVPQPKSEAWLLAYYQKNESKSSVPYQNCARFEDLSGNDSANPKNSAKHILERLCGGKELERDELLAIDWQRVDMPSFNRFRERLYQVLQLYIKQG